MDIVVAGASGYVGRGLIPKLLERFPQATIHALSRTLQPSDDPRVLWKACDLFSVDAVKSALPEKIAVAYYLVHSMGPTANLDQGHFADYDLLLADNFVRALAPLVPKQMIYLGGLIPQDNQISTHLKSRLEVEEVLTQAPWPTVVFRAGLILGEAGSSFQIMLKLVKRLPVMVCPAWTNTKTTPVDLASVIQALTSAAMEESHNQKVYDLSGCRPLTYLEMMKATAQKLGKKKLFLSVPIFSPNLSRLWVSLVTNTPKDLVYPLIDSLRHEMIARPSHRFPGLNADREYSEILGSGRAASRSARRLLKFQIKRNTVRSVQRMELPRGRSARWATKSYLEWLPKYLFPLVKAVLSRDTIRLCFLIRRWKLLELAVDAHRDREDLQQLSIVSGLLVAEGDRGILEFRTVLGGRYLLTAIHDYRPSLPWFIYIFTQARFHLLVMDRFRKQISK
ncbi:MAG: sugar nucleotide-binding protein [Bdellovibrionales bacterium]|nr:sugar nucleotide-binding protein [Bdellovibrionales bacterium]